MYITFASVYTCYASVAKSCDTWHKIVFS